MTHLTRCTFAGAITGGNTGTAGAKTLNVSTAPLSAGGINLSGAITNGGASSLALALTAVSGNVQMNMGNTGNTYTGGTSVANGVRLNVSAGAGALAWVVQVMSPWTPAGRSI